MNEVVKSYEHAGVIVEIVHDEDVGWASNPQDNDNAGKIYSWADCFDGDERISEPDLQVDDAEDWNEPSRWRTIDLNEYMTTDYNAALTIPLRFSDYGSSGSRIHTTDADNANCALVFTRAEIDHEWSGHVDPYPVQRKNADGSTEIIEYGGARKYGEARIHELDNWLQGNVYGIVIREQGHCGSDDTDARGFCNECGEDVNDAGTGEVLESVWGFIGDIFDAEESAYIIEEANSLAEDCAEEIKREADEAHRWACADVVTV